MGHGHHGGGYGGHRSGHSGSHSNADDGSSSNTGWGHSGHRSHGHGGILLGLWAFCSAYPNFSRVLTLALFVWLTWGI